MENVTRKDFLKGMTLGLTGLAAASSVATLAGADEAAGEWDREVQVLVAGTGTAAVCAVMASALGASSVLVVEKDPQMFGGTSITSGGTLALPGTIDDLQAIGRGSTRDEAISYMKLCAEGRLSDAVIENFVDNANDFCVTLKDIFGWTKFEPVNKGYGDYYECYDGAVVDGPAHNVKPFDAQGNPLDTNSQWVSYQEYLESAENVEILMGTAITRLVTDESGAVIGAVLIQQDGTELAVRADAVVLGTGGFDYNEGMRRKYLPFPIYRSVCSQNNTGDAQRMGAKIGAQLACMDRILGVPFCYGLPDWDDDVDPMNYGLFAQDPLLVDWTQATTLPHSVIVNRKGHRFVNEGRFYDVFNRSFGAYDTGVMKYENIPGYWICDATYAANYLLPGYNVAGQQADYFFQANSLEELAEQVGIDPQGLVEEVTRFNENARNGIDPDWHRGESELTRQTAVASCAYYALTPEAAQLDTPASLLGPVETPPFYCCRIVPGTLGTRGGLVTTENAQVVDVDGSPITGLYAVGCSSVGVAGYWSAGASLSQGCVMGYIAAKHILGA